MIVIEPVFLILESCVVKMSKKRKYSVFDNVVKILKKRKFVFDIAK